MTRPGVALAEWYARHGRHELPWRASRDRWAVLVSEVMLQQTQVARVLDAWPAFMARFPDVATTAAAPPADVIVAWGRLGYPRRARALWTTATTVARTGWPADLRSLPGVGRYTAAAVAAQVDDADVVGVEVNIRRVCERVAGRRLRDREAEAVAVEVAEPLSGRDRLLALMDLGATLCTARAPDCARCPLVRRCAARGPLPGGTRARQARYEGSFRQARGRVLARLRAGDAPVHELDRAALDSLVADGLAQVTGPVAHLPTGGGTAPRAARR
ncbi:MAG: DNA glycosylase [Acidimicrobiia bacterium]|nr:MAG: DNA glycosylase [Acidimicrobiia bacterium]